MYCEAFDIQNPFLQFFVKIFGLESFSPYGSLVLKMKELVDCIHLRRFYFPFVSFLKILSWSKTIFSGPILFINLAVIQIP